MSYAKASRPFRNAGLLSAVCGTVYIGMGTLLVGVVPRAASELLITSGPLLLGVGIAFLAVWASGLVVGVMVRAARAESDS